MSRIDASELGAMLRRWRERLTPGDVGLPVGSRRRTPGLRREEVAQLARLSTDYLVRLEQARGDRPSPSVLHALARALRLSPAETAHLFALAGAVLPGPGHIRDVVRPSVLRLLDRMRDLPAFLANARGDILAWNVLAEALIGDLSALAPDRRNHLLIQFGTHDQFCYHMVAGDAERARLDRAAAAQALAALTRYPDDERLRHIIHELYESSSRFARLWDERPVQDRRSDVKTYQVPSVGPLTLDCESLHIPDDDQVLVIYSAPPNSPAAENLDLLRTVGLQRF